MKEQVTVYHAETPGPSGSSTGITRFERLDSETRRSAYRSLSYVAFVYSAVYFIAFFYYWFLNIRIEGAFKWPEPVYLIFSGFGILYGLFTGLLMRRTTCPPRRFGLMAQAFVVVASIGIAGNYWGWQLHGGIHRMPSVEGVPWISVILLMFANVVTVSPRRILTAGILSSLALPGVIYGSVFVLGVPEGMAMTPFQLAQPLAMQMFVPALICVGIAVYSSKRGFDLAEDVSQARRMGSYRLREKIGAGGMGEVWKADHQLLVRPAAIKLIRAAPLGRGDDSASRTLLARFEREAQATSLLTSPHTVQIYDFGITDGTFYYVMELLEGMDLKSLVESCGPVPAARAVRFLRQACDSLADAHRIGLIHRDIKPANLFTCRRGLEYDFTKVLDFGLVKETRPHGGERTQLTMEGIASGTPAFMPPEMATGDQPTDGRADLYALGCVGYWLLTGQLVFEAGSPVAMLLRHAQDAPAPPSTRSELEIPESLDRVILDCLAKNPDDRPATAGELARRLREVEREIGEWSQERAERWWTTHLPELAAGRTP